MKTIKQISICLLFIISSVIGSQLIFAQSKTETAPVHVFTSENHEFTVTPWTGDYNGKGTCYKVARDNGDYVVIVIPDSVGKDANVAEKLQSGTLRLENYDWLYLNLKDKGGKDELLLSYNGPVKRRSEEIIVTFNNNKSIDFGKNIKQIFTDENFKNGNLKAKVEDILLKPIIKVNGEQEYLRDQIKCAVLDFNGLTDTLKLEHNVILNNTFPLKASTTISWLNAIKEDLPNQYEKIMKSPLRDYNLKVRDKSIIVSPAWTTKQYPNSYFYLDKAGKYQSMCSVLPAAEGSKSYGVYVHRIHKIPTEWFNNDNYGEVRFSNSDYLRYSKSKLFKDMLIEGIFTTDDAVYTISNDGYDVNCNIQYKSGEKAGTNVNIPINIYEADLRNGLTGFNADDVAEYLLSNYADKSKHTSNSNQLTLLSYVVKDKNTDIEFTVSPNPKEGTFKLITATDIVTFEPKKEINNFTGEPTGKYLVDMLNISSLGKAISNSKLIDRTLINGTDTLYIYDGKLKWLKSHGFTVGFSENIPAIEPWNKYDNVLRSNAYAVIYSYVLNDFSTNPYYNVGKWKEFINEVSYKGKQLPKKSIDEPWSLGKKDLFMLGDKSFVLFANQPVGVGAICTPIAINSNEDDIRIIQHTADNYPVSMTDNGIIREIKMSNGDYLKFSRRINNQAFEGLLHFPSGTIRLMNDGNKIAAHFDKVEEPDSGFTRVINLGIFDPTIYKDITGKTHGDTDLNSDWQSVNSCWFNHWNTENFLLQCSYYDQYVTETKEPAHWIGNRFVSQTEYDIIMEEKRKAELAEQQRKQAEYEKRMAQNEQKSKAIIAKYVAKWGKKNIDNILAGRITVGMPAALIEDVFLVSETYNAGSYKRWKIMCGPASPNVEQGRITINSGRYRIIQVSIMNGKVYSIY